MNELVTLEVYDNYVSAHIVKSRLEHEGIMSYIKDEQTVTMNWMWSNAIGGIKLQVLKSDEARARELLAADEVVYEASIEHDAYRTEDKSQFDPNNKICIYCGSKNTKAETYRKDWAYTFMLLLGFPIAVKSDKWHCFNCSKKF